MTMQNDIEPVDGTQLQAKLYRFLTYLILDTPQNIISDKQVTLL